MPADDDSSGRKPYGGPSITPIKPPVGRPIKYCYRYHDRVCELISQGASREGAAFGAGLDLGTVYRWMRQFPEFYQDIKKADADFEQSIIDNISYAAKSPKTWQAGAWLLERKKPQQWGRNAIQEQDPGDKRKTEEWVLQTRVSGKKYLLVDIGSADPVDAYHESKQHADIPSQEPTEPE